MPDNRGRFLPGEHWRKPQAFRDKHWLQREYVDNQRSAAEIAAEFGVTDGAIAFWLHRHGIPRRSTSAARAAKHWGSAGEANPMYGKRGTEVPNWKGGIAPDRQAFYSSMEWKAAATAVWERDGGKCRRCSAGREGSRSIAIHHLVAFRVRAKRAEITNLVLLCGTCHRWVHSKANTGRDFLEP